MLLSEALRSNLIAQGLFTLGLSETSAAGAFLKENLAHAHVLALEPGAANGTFNLEGADPVTLRRIIEDCSRSAAAATRSSTITY